MMQVSTIPIPFTKGKYQLGTGVLSTMGTANQYNAIFPIILYDIMSYGYTLDEAWGKLLGTIMACVWIEGLISFVPYKILKKVFPPYVLGVTVSLIGVQVREVDIIVYMFIQLRLDMCVLTIVLYRTFLGNNNLHTVSLAHRCWDEILGRWSQLFRLRRCQLPMSRQR